MRVGSNEGGLGGGISLEFICGEKASACRAAHVFEFDAHMSEEAPTNVKGACCGLGQAPAGLALASPR